MLAGCSEKAHSGHRGRQNRGLPSELEELVDTRSIQGNIYKVVYVMGATMTSENREQGNQNGSDQTDKTLIESLKPLIGRCLALNHELNNYMAGIVGYCELLLDGEEQLSDDQRQMIRAIRKCANKIGKHIKAMAKEKALLADMIDLKPFLEATKNDDERSD